MKTLLVLLSWLLVTSCSPVPAVPSVPVLAAPTPRPIRISANAPRWDHYGRPINRDPYATPAPSTPARINPLDRRAKRVRFVYFPYGFGSRVSEK